MNRTFVMCKPDAVERGLVGEIVGRLERKGLTLVAAELPLGRPRRSPRSTTPSTPSKPFFGELVEFITRVPVFAMVRRGPGRQHLLARPHADRRHQRSTTPQPGTIRGDFATITTENLVHG